MSFKFKLTRWDIFYTSVVMSFRQPYLVIILALGFMYITYVNWSGTSEYSLIVRLLTTILFCIPPLLFLLVSLGLYILLIVLSKNNSTLLSEQDWVINSELLTYETEIIRSEFKWKAVKKISVIGSYCFLYLSQMGACIIPKRAFSSDNEWKEFISLCRSKLQK